MAADLLPLGSANVHKVEGLQKLPKVLGHVFLDINDHFGGILAGVLGPIVAKADPLDSVTIMQLALENFDQQAPKVQDAFIHSILLHLFSTWTHTLKEKALLRSISEIQFIWVTHDLSRKSPCQVVSPEAPLAKIYPTSHSRRIDVERYRDSKVIEMLAKLNLLQKELTQELVDERITELESQPKTDPEAYNNALDLLVLMDETTSVVWNPAIGRQWLPAREIGGRPRLHTSQECWDDFMVCSRVLSTVPYTIKNLHLRAALGWGRFLPINRFEKQLKETIISDVLHTHQKAEQLVKLIQYASKGLDKGEYSDNDIRMISIDETYRWIPVSRTELVKPSHAVFTDGLDPDLIFKKALTSLCEPKCKRLLKLIGCRERYATPQYHIRPLH